MKTEETDIENILIGDRVRVIKKTSSKNDAGDIGRVAELYIKGKCIKVEVEGKSDGYKSYGNWHGIDSVVRIIEPIWIVRVFKDLFRIKY